MQFFNRVKFTTATTGTGTLTVGTEVSNFRTPAQASVPNGTVVRYVIEEGSAWETGYGTYNTSGTTLTRNVLQSSNSDALITLAGAAVVRLTFLAEDLSSIGGNPSWLNLIDFVYPSSSGWTWDNQGSGTIDSTAGWEYQYCPAKGAIQLQLRYRTPVNTHFQIDAAFMLNIGVRATIGDGGLIFGFRDSAGKIVSFMDFQESSNWALCTYKWNSSTSVSAQYARTTAYPQVLNGYMPVFLRIKYDGTNIIFYRTLDAYHYEQFDTRTLTDFLGSGTPNVCWGAYCNSGNIAVALVHYVETALA